jgi:pyruvate dehydrogenase E2 component (dihydrolipoamide acetyltransferase)
MGEFRMPSLGADMEVGTIIEWHVKPGDTVHRGDIIALVDTEKSDIEVEVFENGVIEELVVEPGVTVPVGTILARLAPIGAAVPGPAAAAAPAATAAATAPTKEARAPVKPVKRRRPPRRRARHTAPATTGEAFVRASPLARRQATQRNIDLATVAGSGPDGAVVVADLGPVGSTSVARQTPKRDRAAAARHATGLLMARSKRDIPHYYLATTIDLGRAIAWLTDINADRPVTDRMLPAALLLKATALAAREVDVMNGFWDDSFHPSSAVHLGVAVSLRGGGLVAPAIHDADRVGLDAMMETLRDVVTRARSGSLRSSEVSDATITVTNLGDQGVDEVFGVIYPPQVALVGFGRIAERPWASAGMLGVRPVVRASLSADHRASDGRQGARFLAAIDRLLNEPENL